MLFRPAPAVRHAEARGRVVHEVDLDEHRRLVTDDHIAITGIFSIGSEKPCSLCGEVGSKFWIDEWRYPAIGVYFADCPSAGHDMVCLDYRACGSTGEPLVVHIDQEWDYKIVFVAESFEAFIRGRWLDGIINGVKPARLEQPIPQRQAA